MISLRESFLELTKLTKQYLLQEHSPADRLLSDSETYGFFRDYAANKKQTLPKTLVTSAPPARFVPPKITPTFTQPAKPASSPIKTSSSPSPQQAETLEEKSFPIVSLKESEFKGIIADKKESKEKEFFTLEHPLRAPLPNFDDLRKAITEKAPHYAFINQVPDDNEAKEMMRLWKKKQTTSQVVVLSFDEAPKHQAFLNHLVKALELHGISATVSRAIKHEQNKSWHTLTTPNPLKLIIAASQGLNSLPELQKNYREASKQGKHFLGETPLLLLSDLSFYLKEPSLKAPLWKAILTYFN